MIYTFYSYKGGVGRTMALANIAELFYRAGLRVAMVDFDLEAPGLERFFADVVEIDDVLKHPGVMDLLMEYKQRMAQPLSAEEREKGPSFPVAGVNEYYLDIYSRSRKRKLLFFPAGKRSGDQFSQYVNSILTFDWQDFYDNWEGERFFEWLRQKLSDLADVILIDSRTGLTEMSGVCTYQLADAVILFCPPNQQSIDGIYRMAQKLMAPEVEKSRGRPLDVLVLPSRVDLNYDTSIDEFHKEFLRQFDDLALSQLKMSAEDMWELRIPYVPRYAYREKVAVREADLASAVDMTNAVERLFRALASLMPQSSSIRKKIEKEFRGRKQPRGAGELPLTAEIVEYPPVDQGRNISKKRLGRKVSSIYLSYTEEDSATAKRLVDHLRDASHLEIYDWNDPAQRGKEFIPEIEQQINGANFFVALLSPDYLLSPWCKHERNLALRRYEHQKDIVILVAKTRDVDYLSAGFLGGFDWLNLREASWENDANALVDKISAISSDLKPEVGSENASIANWPTFQDREDELDEVVGNLNDMVGERFFLVLSGPQMGKSWFLEQVHIKLVEREAKSNWKVIKVDLRDFTNAAWKDPDFILSRLFDIKSSDGNETNKIEEAIRVISHSKRPWLCILDSAELLSNKAAAELRDSLSRIYKDVKVHVPDADFAFITASRLRHDKWKGMSPSPRFQEIRLPHFSFEVIRNALREMTEVDKRYKFKDEWYNDIAFRLRNATDGVPSLLIEYMQWIREKEYVFVADEINGVNLFDKFAKPFISNTLLSPNNLLLTDRDHKPSAGEENILEKTLLGLSCYRIISITFLENLFKLDDELQKSLSTLKWTREDLWQRLLNTPLIEPSSQIWVRTYTAIRRLLFRYHYDTPQKQANAHLQAGQFYDGFWNDLAGTDKSIVLVERLWHQVEYERLSKTEDSKTRLLRFAKELFTIGIKSNHYTREELSGLIEQRIGDDQELITSLEIIDPNGVERLIGIIQRTKDV